MKKNLLNIISYGLIGYTLGSAVIIGTPELQELIPQFTNQVAVWTGLPAGTLGALGLAFQSYINNARKVDNEIATTYTGALDKTLQKVDKLTQKIEDTKNDMDSKYQVLEQKYDRLYGALNRIVVLIETDLNAKLSNTLIDEHVKKMIEGVLKESDE